MREFDVIEGKNGQKMSFSYFVGAFSVFVSSVGQNVSIGVQDLRELFSGSIRINLTVFDDVNIGGR
jgi:hypothetical protein